MSIESILIINELTRVGAVKVKADNYDKAWSLRNKVNGELRRTGVKGQYTSAVIGDMLMVWRVDMFGNKGSKHLVLEALEPLNTPTMTAKQLDRKGAPDTEKIFEEIRVEEKRKAETKLANLIGKLGKR